MQGLISALIAAGIFLSRFILDYHHTFIIFYDNNRGAGISGYGRVSAVSEQLPPGSQDDAGYYGRMNVTDTTASHYRL